MIKGVGYYVGYPYESADCWDFVRVLYRAFKQIRLGPVDKQAERVSGGEWLHVKSIDEAEDYDVLVFQNGTRKHVGMVIDDGFFIHSDKKVGTCIESYRANKWKHKLRGIYRHRELM